MLRTTSRACCTCVRVAQRGGCDHLPAWGARGALPSLRSAARVSTTANARRDHERVRYSPISASLENIGFREWLDHVLRLDNQDVDIADTGHARRCIIALTTFTEKKLKTRLASVLNELQYLLGQATRATKRRSETVAALAAACGVHSRIGPQINRRTELKVLTKELMLNAVNEPEVFGPDGHSEAAIVADYAEAQLHTQIPCPPYWELLIERLEQERFPTGPQAARILYARTHMSRPACGENGAHIPLPRDDLWEGLWAAYARDVPSLDGSHVSMAWIACAAIMRLPAEASRGAAFRSIEAGLPTMSARDTASLVWSLYLLKGTSKLDSIPRFLVRPLTIALQERLSDMSPRDIGNMVGACGALKIPATNELLRATREAVQDTAIDMTPREVALACFGLATTSVQSPDLAAQVINRMLGVAVRDKVIRNFTPERTGNTLWAAAVMYERGAKLNLSNITELCLRGERLLMQSRATETDKAKGHLFATYCQLSDVKVHVLDYECLDICKAAAVAAAPKLGLLPMPVRNAYSRVLSEVFRAIEVENKLDTEHEIEEWVALGDGSIVADYLITRDCKEIGGPLFYAVLVPRVDDVFCDEHADDGVVLRRGGSIQLREAIVEGWGYGVLRPGLVDLEEGQEWDEGRLVEELKAQALASQAQQLQQAPARYNFFEVDEDIRDANEGVIELGTNLISMEQSTSKSGDSTVTRQSAQDEVMTPTCSP